MSAIPIALTIAGSDSGGGAGIQADLRTFAFHCVHGTSAITCVTAQNTLGVDRVKSLSPDLVAAQIDSVAEDIGVGAAKTGMLPNEEIIAAVAERSRKWRISPLVVDPVMVSRTGAQLLPERTVSVLRDLLLPEATILTPNHHEAKLLSGLEIYTLDDMRAAAKRIHRLGPKIVLVKGGGMAKDLRGVDVLYDGETFQTLKTETIATPHTHGTGCTLSAAIAANLARKQSILDAIHNAKDFVTHALRYALAIGKGQGPVGHFYKLLEEPRDAKPSSP